MPECRALQKQFPEYHRLWQKKLANHDERLCVKTKIDKVKILGNDTGRLHSKSCSRYAVHEAFFWLREASYQVLFLPIIKFSWKISSPDPDSNKENLGTMSNTYCHNDYKIEWSWAENLHTSRCLETFKPVNFMLNGWDVLSTWPFTL